MDWAHLGELRGSLVAVDATGSWLGVAVDGRVTVHAAHDLSARASVAFAPGHAVAIDSGGRIAAHPVTWLAFTSADDLVAFDVAGGVARVRVLDATTGATLATATPEGLDGWCANESPAPVVAPAPGRGVVVALNRGDDLVAVVGVEVAGDPRQPRLRLHDGERLLEPLRGALVGERALAVGFADAQTLFVLDSDQSGALLRWDADAPSATRMPLPDRCFGCEAFDAEDDVTIYNGPVARWRDALALPVEELAPVADGWSYLPVGLAIVPLGRRSAEDPGGTWPELLSSPSYGESQLVPLAPGLVAELGEGTVAVWRWG